MIFQLYWNVFYLHHYIIYFYHFNQRLHVSYLNTGLVYFLQEGFRWGSMFGLAASTKEAAYFNRMMYCLKSHWVLFWLLSLAIQLVKYQLLPKWPKERKNCRQMKLLSFLFVNCDVGGFSSRVDFCPVGFLLLIMPSFHFIFQPSWRNA